MIDTNEVYLSDEVCTDAVLKCFESSFSRNNRLHAVAIYKDNTLLVKMALRPHSTEFKPQVYSMSKSFTATAIGILYDRKLLSLEEHITEIFKDRWPSEICDTMKMMKVKHLLSMTTGHSACVFSGIKNSEDIVKSFLETTPAYVPGTFFAYNNAATYILSEIVTKITGMTLFDFISINLFDTLGIKNTHWDASKNGKSMGAIGLHVSVEDIAKLGRLYLNKGIWEGKRVLSEKWCALATTKRVDNAGNGTPDWVSGYGYQFWMNAKEGFRGDGACGQLCLVLPRLHMVAAVQGFCHDMQGEIDDVMDMVYTLCKPSTVSKEYLINVLNSKTEVEKSEEMPNALFGRTYRCNSNLCEITEFAFHAGDKGVKIEFSGSAGKQYIFAGNGCYVENTIHAKYLKPNLLALSGTGDMEKLHFAASFQYKDAVFVLNIVYLDNPYSDFLEFLFEDDGVKVKSNCGNTVLSREDFFLTAGNHG